MGARHFDDAHITAVHALEHLPALAGDGGSQSDAAIYEHAQQRATELMRDSWSGPLRSAGPSSIWSPTTATRPM